MSKYGKCKSLIESVDGPADCAARAEKGYCPKRMWRGKESKYKVTATCWKVQDREPEVPRKGSGISAASLVMVEMAAKEVERLKEEQKPEEKPVEQ